MARFAGLVIVLWAVYTSIAFSLESIPPAVDPDASADPAPPAEPYGAPAVLSEMTAAVADPSLETGAAPDALAAAWSHGTYLVTEGAEELEGASDGAVGHDGDEEATGRREGAGNGQEQRPRHPRDTDDGDSDSHSGDRSRGTPRGTIEPGLYATGFDAAGCSYQLWREMRDRTEQVIGADELASGRLLVTINEIEPDWFSSTPGCSGWSHWEAQPDPLRVAPNGDYWVGDLARGRWSVPRGCRWESVVGFRGARLYDVIDSVVGPDVVEVDRESLGTRIRGCHTPAELLAPPTPRIG